LPKGSKELPTLDDVSQIEQNPKFDGTVVDGVEAKTTNWLAAVLLAGGDPNGTLPETDWMGRRDRVLCHAAKSGYEDGVRLLLQLGADPNREGCYTRNALAVGARYPAIVTMLFEKGANPNAGDAGSCYNPLACAARAESVELLRLMLAHGGDASRVDRRGQNVLHQALIYTSAECCRELLAHGADPCGRGGRFDNETPMHVVAKFGSLDDGPERVKILDLLLESGASLLVRDWGGATPGDRARQRTYGRAASKEVLEWFAHHETV
jgi:ankyrin repeat protein